MSNVCSLEETLLKRPASPIGIDFSFFWFFFLQNVNRRNVCKDADDDEMNEPRRAALNVSYPVSHTNTFASPFSRGT